MYGGAFNPPTIAHENIIKTILKHIQVDKLVVVPVGHHYKKDGLVDIQHRIEMLSRLNVPIIIEDIERDHFQGSLHTLKQLELKYNRPFGFIIGSDQLEHIHTWIEYQQLFAHYNVMIVKRPNFDIQPYISKLEDLKCQYQILDMDFNLSSTDFRTQKKHPLDVVTKEVLDYINEHHLYKE
jgi:nicotinate-nucleotide adenylyltransferase